MGKVCTAVVQCFGAEKVPLGQEEQTKKAFAGNANSQHGTIWGERSLHLGGEGRADISCQQ